GEGLPMPPSPPRGEGSPMPPSPLGGEGPGVRGMSQGPSPPTPLPGVPGRGEPERPSPPLRGRGVGVRRREDSPSPPAPLPGVPGRGENGAAELSETAAALLLCNPLNPLILDKGWSEPLLALAVAGCLWAAA